MTPHGATLRNSSDRVPGRAGEPEHRLQADPLPPGGPAPVNGPLPSSPAAPSLELGQSAPTSASASGNAAAETRFLEIPSADFGALAEAIPHDRRQRLVLSVLRDRLPAGVTAQGFRSFFGSEEGQALEGALRGKAVPPGALSHLLEAVFAADPVFRPTRDDILYRNSVRVGLEANGQPPALLPDERLGRPSASRRRRNSGGESPHREADRPGATAAEAETLYARVAAQSAGAAVTADALGLPLPLPASRATPGVAGVAAKQARPVARRRACADCAAAHCLGARRKE